MGGIAPSAPGASGEGRCGGRGAGAICNGYKAEAFPWGPAAFKNSELAPHFRWQEHIFQQHPVTKLDISAVKCVNGERREAIDSLPGYK